MQCWKLFLIIFILSPATLTCQKFESLAQTPPMGWNSWNTFATDIHEDLVKEIADNFIELGLRDAGYTYLVLDDGWMARERDATGNLVAHPEKFPSGMKALADYIHERGLKFGLYNCAGKKTCAGYPGSQGHEYQDARRYASWGVDYLKYDWCNTGTRNAPEAYATMRDALYVAGRPVVFSICEWGDNQPWNWGKDIGHLWRTTGDITNCWDCEVDHGSWSSWGILRVIDMRSGIRRYAGPGHWNDPDMMEVGNGMSASEDRAHFAMWCMLAAPLIMGNDLRNASEETVGILTNRDLIAVNQDPLGVQALKYWREGPLEVWAKPLANGDWAVSFLNRGAQQIDLSWNWSRHQIADDHSGKRMEDYAIYRIQDLWTGETNDISATLKRTIAPHDMLVYRLILEQ